MDPRPALICYILADGPTPTGTTFDWACQIIFPAMTLFDKACQMDHPTGSHLTGHVKSVTRTGTT